MEDTTAIVEWVAHKARPQAKPRETTPAIGANTLPRAPTSAISVPWRPWHSNATEKPVQPWRPWHKDTKEPWVDHKRFRPADAGESHTPVANLATTTSNAASRSFNAASSSSNAARSSTNAASSSSNAARPRAKHRPVVNTVAPYQTGSPTSLPASSPTSVPSEHLDEPPDWGVSIDLD